ncbi:MAG: hypothetical protein Q9159_005187 [Coniocarpon cinnabarinum]
MSAPSPAASASVPQPQKRPLEDPSSDADPNDQPEAKRQALHKEEAANGQSTAPEDPVPSGDTTAQKPEPDVDGGLIGKGEQATNGTELGEDNQVPGSASNLVVPTEAKSDAGTQPIESVSNNLPTQAVPQYTPQQTSNESDWLHIRAIISSAEAATVIGKSGENVSEIRKRSGAKCTVSDYSRGAVERVLTVSGLVDAVAKAFGLIIRTLNTESLDQPSDTNSKTYPLRLLIPHVLIGSIIGQKGVRIREIQEASGARLNASDSCLPLSTERSLVVLGVADSVHIATYYVGSTLVEQLTERFGGPSASAYATRSGAPAGVVPGGLQVVPYAPQPAGGQWGHPNNYNRRHPQQTHQQSHSHPSHPQAGSYNNHTYPQQPSHTPQYASQSRGYHGAGPQAPQAAGGYGQQPQGYGQQPQYPPQAGQQQHFPGQPLTQQIYIPNDMVGAIIGKGGAKINEIRQLSGSVIKINEPQDNSNERLVTITGTQECNQMALYMLYQRLVNGE